jgi:hypothetical protein
LRNHGRRSAFPAQIQSGQGIYSVVGDRNTQ